MALSTCPSCDRLVDIDGYFEHGEPTLFYCECGRIYDMIKFGELTEVKKNEVDLFNFDARLLKEEFTGNRGVFIKKSRWEKPI